MLETKQSRRELVAAYGEYVSREMTQGWNGYLLTFMYSQLRGTGSGILHLMFDEVERVYATLLTRIIRNPSGAGSQGKLPRMIACPDLPIFRHGKQSLSDLAVNGGRHVHAIYLTPPWSRLQEPLDQHVARHPNLYLGRQGRLSRIHIVPIQSEPAYVTDYALKALKNGRTSGDDLLILPRMKCELPERHSGDAVVKRRVHDARGRLSQQANRQA